MTSHLLYSSGPRSLAVKSLGSLPPFKSLLLSSTLRCLPMTPRMLISHATTAYRVSRREKCQHLQVTAGCQALKEAQTKCLGSAVKTSTELTASLFLEGNFRLHMILFYKVVLTRTIISEKSPLESNLSSLLLLFANCSAQLLEMGSLTGFFFFPDPLSGLQRELQL